VTIRRWLFALAGALALLVPVGMPMWAATTHQVEIVDFAFGPAALTITVGDTVTWTNSDVVAHTATGSGFDSGLLDQGQSYSLTFTAPGTDDYLCTPHPTMTGQIVVEAAAAAATPGAVPNVAMDAPTTRSGWLALVAGVGAVSMWLMHRRRLAVRNANRRRR
jgi:amicyanin